MNKHFQLTENNHIYAWQWLPAIILMAISLMTFQASAANQSEVSKERVSPIKRAEPKYPKYAVKRNIEGSVLIIYSIEKDGAVSDIEVVKSDQEGLFDASAILAVQKWMFTQPSKKMRNNYVAIEFALSDKPDTTQFANVEKIQVRGE